VHKLCKAWTNAVHVTVCDRNSCSFSVLLWLLIEIPQKAPQLFPAFPFVSRAASLHYPPYNSFYEQEHSGGKNGVGDKL